MTCCGRQIWENHIYLYSNISLTDFRLNCLTCCPVCLCSRSQRTPSRSALCLIPSADIHWGAWHVPSMFIALGMNQWTKQIILLELMKIYNLVRERIKLKSNSYQLTEKDIADKKIDGIRGWGDLGNPHQEGYSESDMKVVKERTVEENLPDRRNSSCKSLEGKGREWHRGRVEGDTCREVEEWRLEEDRLCNAIQGVVKAFAFPVLDGVLLGNFEQRSNMICPVF